MKQILIPVGALVFAVGIGGWAEAGQHDQHGRDRNGRASEGQSHQRGSSGPQGRVDAPAPAPAPSREVAPAPRGGSGVYGGGTVDNRAQRRSVAPAPPSSYGREGNGRPGYSRPGYDRGDSRAYSYGRRDDDRGYGRNGYYDRGNYDRGGHYAYRAPYPAYGYGYYGRAPRHYYGPGGHLSVYFGWGSGYLFGAPYYGRVYGYVGAPVYGARAYYGDVRLLVQPRDAQVYVDGYYAGIVDDFDGAFQRLTLTAGPHQIEIDAPGLEPRFFDVYVDPARTIDLHADLFR